MMYYDPILRDFVWQSDIQKNIRMHTDPSVSQDHFRFRDDTGGVDATPTWMALEDTNVSDIALGKVFRLRIGIQENVGGEGNNYEYKLQYNYDGGGWNDVTTTSDYVIASSSASSSADGTAISTGRLAGLSGTLITGGASSYEDNGEQATNAVAWTANNHIEIEFGLQIRDTGTTMAGTTSIQFRCINVDNTTITVNATPQLTTAAAAQDVQPPLYTNTSTLHTPTISTGSVNLDPPLYTDPDTLHTPSVVRITYLDPPLISDGDTLHEPTVSVGATTVAPPLYTNTNTLHEPTITTGVVILAPTIITDGDVLYAPTVALEGDQLLVPLLDDSTDTFHAPTVTVGAVTLTPPLLTDGDTFHAPTVTGGLDIQPPLYSDGDTLHTPTLSVGAVNLDPPLITDSASFYTHNISQPVGISPPLLASSTSLFAPVVVAGTVNIAPPFFGDEDIFPEPNHQVIQAGRRQTWTVQDGGAGIWTEIDTT